MAERYYIDEECQICGADCGSRLCDDCKAETEILFRALCLENLSPYQLRYLSTALDGVYLTDYVRGGGNGYITDIMFIDLCLENFNSDQLLYLSTRLDGVNLTDYLKG